MALKHLLASAALVGLMAQPGLAQSQDTTQQQPAQAEQQQLAQEDMEFATKAAQGGLKEVRLGELAQQQAEREEVRQFGQRMVEDHGQANEQLMQIAQDKGIELPQELADEDQQIHDELQQKSGAEFDQAYMDEMVRDHEEDIEEFRQYLESGQDPDLTGFAEQTLPVLEEHLQLAQQTQEQLTAVAATDEQPDATMGETQQEALETEQQAATETEQQAVTGEAQQEPAATEQQAATEPQQPISIDEVLGSRVVNAAGEEVATVDDLVIGQDGQYHVVLSVGGFLGIGERKVAVPLDELQLSEDEVYLMTATTEEQLEQMPEYDEDQFQPYAQQ